MLKVGVVGLGGMGSVHTSKYVQMADVQVCGFDVDPDRRGSYEQRFGVTTESSMDALLRTCDVIDVCLPTHLHVEAALQVIAAGRALLLEKPVAMDFASAMKIHEAAHRAQVPYMPGQVVRCFPEYRAMHDYVAAGKIGTPAAARTRRGGRSPVGSGAWFQDVARSGGVLLDLAVHDFDWLRWTLGEVKTVYSRSVVLNQKPESWIGDYALTTLGFDSGAVAHVEATWMDPSGFRTTVEVAGSGGLIEHDSRNTPALRTHLDGKSMAEGSMAATDDPYFIQLSGFLNSVRSKTPPPVSGLDGAMAVSIACATMESCQTGKVVVPSRP